MALRNRKMPGVNQNRFTSVPQANIPRSQFDRSHGLKTTFDAGYLIPIYVDEMVPGDTFNVKMTGVVRLTTPLTPFMDNLHLSTQFFKIPIRLVHENFVRMMGEQDNPGDSTDFLTPTSSPPAGGYGIGTIHDYMGLPTGVEGFSHRADFLRAYNLTWNEWYRDENLQIRVPFSKGDGPDPYTDFAIKRRGKRKDYFTSSLPFPQKGDAVNVPLGDTAPVISSGDGIPVFAMPGSPTHFLQGTPTNNQVAYSGAAVGSVQNMQWELPKLVTDLTAATAATINSLREAWQIQRLLERDARGGTRYTELVQSHFRVISPDSRLQRPEYIGGGSTPIYVNPVANTAEEGTAAVGDLGAVATAMPDGHGFTCSAEEHCIIIGLMSVRADITYQQGLERMWSRRERFDFYWPALAHLGEQAVLNKEIYTQGTAEDEEVFGYQERFAEMRYKPSRISGQFRSTAPQSLDVWHLSQQFGSLPVLSDSFIQDTPPVERVVAVQDEPHFRADLWFRDIQTRPMPTYSVPGLVDHF